MKTEETSIKEPNLSLKVQPHPTTTHSYIYKPHHTHMPWLGFQVSARHLGLLPSLLHIIVVSPLPCHPQRPRLSSVCAILLRFNLKFDGVLSTIATTMAVCLPWPFSSTAAKHRKPLSIYRPLRESHFGVYI